MAFLRRKFAFLLVFLIVAAAGGALVSLLRPNFKAQSAIVIDLAKPQAVSLGDVVSGAAADDETIATEIAVITSYDLAKEVIRRLHLDTNPDYNPQLNTSPIHLAMKQVKAAIRTASAELFGATAEPPVTDPMNDMVDIVQHHLTVEQVDKSRLIGITFSAHDPLIAASVANAVAEAYTRSRVDLVRKQTRDANEWIKAELGRLREQADQSASEARAFRDAHGLVKTADSTLLQQEVAQVQTQLTQAKATVAQAEAAARAADQALATGNLDQLSTVLGSALIGRLREQEATAAAQASQASSNLGPQHPSVLSARAALRDVQGKIGAEIQRIHRSIHTDLNVAKSNELMLEGRLKEVSSNIALTGPAELKLEELQRASDIATDLYTSFLTRSRQTSPELNYAPVNARVQWLAAVPTSAAFPTKPILLALVMVLGGMAGAVVVVIAELRARGLRSPDQVERMGLVCLGQVPLLRRRAKPVDRLMHDDALADVFANLTFGSGDGPRSVLVTSALPQEGKTHFTLALARLVASRGFKVLLVDADLRRSTLSKLLSETGVRRGLAEILAGQATPTDVFFADRLGGAIVLPAGRCMEEASALLGRPTFASLLRTLESEVDLVLIDAPPVLAAVDAKIIAPHVQHTVFLARWGRTDVQIVQEAIVQIARAGVNRLGVVLSMVDSRRSRTYDRGNAVRSGKKIRDYYGSRALLPSAARSR